MTETATLGLPLVQAAQAQKHITVNEAFTRLDALTQVTLAGIGTTAPPPSPGEGLVYAVGAGATGDWTGFDGMLAVFSNGGWIAVLPVTGWRAWSVSDGAVVTFDGVDWVPGLAALGSMGSATVQSVLEIDHSVSVGSVSTVSGALPGGALVVGVSARVTADIGGVAGLDIGVSGDATRFGQGLGTALGETLATVAAAPAAYSGGGDIVLTAAGGVFNGSGSVRLAVHLMTLRPSR